MSDIRYAIRSCLILTFSPHTKVPTKKALIEDSEANSKNSRNETHLGTHLSPVQLIAFGYVNYQRKKFRWLK